MDDDGSGTYVSGDGDGLVWVWFCGGSGCCVIDRQTK